MSDEQLNTDKAAANRSARSITKWYGRLEDATLFPDLDYWQSQTDDAKFEAAWQMVLEAHQMKGETVARRLQRTTEDFQRRQG